MSLPKLPARAVNPTTAWTDQAPPVPARTQRLNYPTAKDASIFQRVIQPATGRIAEREVMPGHPFGITLAGVPLHVRDLTHDGARLTIELVGRQP